MAVRVKKDRDRGARRRVRQVRDLSKGARVTVGVHAEKASGAYAGGATTLEVAIWNEFGTGRIPERSFLRAWFDENKERARQDWSKMMRAVAKGKLSKEDALERFGQRVVGEIQARIASSIPPPNAASTVARKGSSTTLVDTGQLRTSITYIVHPGGEH